MDANEQPRMKPYERNPTDGGGISVTLQGNIAYTPCSERMVSCDFLNNFIYDSAKKVKI